VYLPSIYPTTCDLAGLEVPETVDFPTLKGILDGKVDRVHEAIFGNYRHFLILVLYVLLGQYFSLVCKELAGKGDFVKDASDDLSMQSNYVTLFAK